MKNPDAGYRTDPPRSRKGAATRGRILETARRMLIADGYDGVVMRNVAAAADMTLGNLQHYFPTREALLAAVVSAEAESDLADIRRLRERADDPQTLLRTTVQTLIRKWRGESGKVTSLLGFLAQHLPVFRDMYRDVYEAFYRELALTIAALDDDVGEREALRRARLVTALLDGASQQVNRGESGRFLDQVADEALRIARG
jgi:AcrR family transcriptional regulator